MIASIIYIIGGFIETVVSLRFILRLVGANPGNGIVQWIYDCSTPFVAPFSGMFGQDATVVNGVGAVTTTVFDWTALIALVVIALIMGFIGAALNQRHIF